MTKRKINSNSKNEAYSAWKESMWTYETQGNKTSWQIGEDMRALNQLKLIENTVVSISKSKADLYFIKTARHTNRRSIEMTYLGKILSLLLKSRFDEIETYFPDQSFNPYIELYIKTVRSHGLDQIPYYPLHLFQVGEVDHWYPILNAFVDTLKRETNTPEFKASIRKVQRNANKNYKSLINYIRALIGDTGRILGLRIDTGYKKISYFDRAGIDISYEEAKCHRGSFIKAIHKQFKKVWVGYAVKFEHGLLKGYHNHILIFLDGSQVRNDPLIAKMMGEYWNNVTTEGRGVYYNCNGRKASYRFRGIGMLTHDDATIWKGLEMIATYMTKPDYFIKLNLPGNDRAFLKGGTPKKTLKKRGRPRKTDSTRNDKDDL